MEEKFMKKAMAKVKEGAKDALNWAKTNKKKLIIGGAAVDTGVTALVIKALLNKGDCEAVFAEEESSEEETWTPGRNCTMTFTVNETGEELGKIACTESYVNDMLDCE